MADNYKKKKEEESLNYLSQNFLENGADNMAPVPPSDALGFLNNNVPSNEFVVVPLDILPCGVFYKLGTKISIRSAKVQEVQAYSVVDDNNYLDIAEKMNEILSSCVRYIHSNGTIGSYKDLRDGDRLFLVFMIRELTFPGGKNLSKEVTCEHCHHEFKIEFRATASSTARKTFVNYSMPEKLNKYFDKTERVYAIRVDEVEYKMAPPTVGIQETFFSDMKSKVLAEMKPNVSFLKISSFLLHDRSKITDEGIKAKEQEFKRMDMKTFQVLNAAANLMVFGIQELKTICPSCGLEVRTNMSFPDGASSLFIPKEVLSEYFE